jgi:hypothetical protein
VNIKVYGNTISIALTDDILKYNSNEFDELDKLTFLRYE